MIFLGTLLCKNSFRAEDSEEKMYLEIVGAFAPKYHDSNGDGKIDTSEMSKEYRY